MSRLGCGAALLFFLAAVFFRTETLLVTKNLNASAEAMSLAGSLRVMNGKHLYPSLTHENSWIYPYQPLHALITGGLGRLFSIDSLQRRVGLVRCVSIACFALLLIFWVAWLRQFHVGRSALFFVICLALPRFADYQSVARNDLMYILFELIAAWFAFRSLKHKSNYWLAIIFSLVAFFTRQVVPPVFLGLLLFQMNRQQSLRFSLTLLSWMAVAGALIFQLQFASQGNYIDHVFVKPAVGFKTSVVDISLAYFVLSYGAYLALSVVGFFNSPKDPIWDLAKSLAIASVVVGIVGYLRQWSDSNFFLESVVFLSPFATRPLPTWLKSKPGALALTAQFLFCGALYFGKSIHFLRATHGDYSQVAQLLRQHYPQGGYVTGPLNGTLVLHLEDWAKNGPDVASFVWPSLSNTHLPSEPGEIWVNAGEHAQSDAKISRGVFGGKTPVECPVPWVCVYRL